MPLSAKSAVPQLFGHIIYGMVILTPLSPEPIQVFYEFFQLCLEPISEQPFEFGLFSSGQACTFSPLTEFAHTPNIAPHDCKPYVYFVNGQKIVVIECVSKCLACLAPLVEDSINWVCHVSFLIAATAAHASMCFQR
jgi:hypothetical protein